MLKTTFLLLPNSPFYTLDLANEPALHTKSKSKKIYLVMLMMEDMHSSKSKPLNKCGRIFNLQGLRNANEFELHLFSPFKNRPVFLSISKCI